MSKIDKHKNIFVIFGFDMETDVGSWTPFYNGLLEGTPLILDLLEKKDVKATFFFTGEAAKLHPPICRLVDDKNHEVGAHSLYHETVGDPIFEIPGVKPLLKSEVKPRLILTTEILKEALGGKTALSFRSPRLWGSTEVVNSLEELGYKTDLSYPLYYHEKQLVPYHPSKDSWLEKGDLKIIEVPNFADLTIKSEDPYGRDRDQWPLFRIEGAKSLMNHVNNFIEYVFNKNLDAVVCFYFHPWEFIKMPSKFHFGEGTVIPDEFIIKNCGDYALKQLDILIDLLLEKESVFLTAIDLATKYKWS